MYNSITCNTWGMTKEVETAETSVSISLCMPHGTACFSFVLIIDFTGICVINIPFLLFLTHVHTLIYTTTRESSDLKLIRSPWFQIEIFFNRHYSHTALITVSFHPWHNFLILHFLDFKSRKTVVNWNWLSSNWSIPLISIPRTGKHGQLDFLNLSN